VNGLYPYSSVTLGALPNSNGLIVGVVMDSQSNFFLTDYQFNLYKVTNGVVTIIYPTTAYGGIGGFLAIDGYDNIYAGEGIVSGSLGYSSLQTLSAGSITTSSTGFVSVQTYLIAGTSRNSNYPDGVGTGASLSWINGIAFTDGQYTIGGGSRRLQQFGSGSWLLITEIGLHTIRIVDANAGQVTTIAGRRFGTGYKNGVGTFALFNNPQGIALNSQGTIFVADHGNFAIRAINWFSLAVSTVAGTAGVSGLTDGLGTYAQFSSPGSITVDPSNNIFIFDGSKLRMIPAGTGNQVITTSYLTSAGTQILADVNGNVEYGYGKYFYQLQPVIATTFLPSMVSQYPSHVPNTKSSVPVVIPTSAPSSPSAKPTRFPTTFKPTSAPSIAPSNYFSTFEYITTTLPFTSPVSPLCVSPLTNAPPYSCPIISISSDSSNNYFFATNNAIYKVPTGSSTPTLFAGSDTVAWPGNNPSVPASSGDNIGTLARFGYIVNFAVAPNTNNDMYVLDVLMNAIRKVTAGAVVSTVAGYHGTVTDIYGRQYSSDGGLDKSSFYVLDGQGLSARFAGMQSIKVDNLNPLTQQSGYFIVADLYNIRRVDMTSYQVTTIAGSTQTWFNGATTAPETGLADGVGTFALFTFPTDIAIDSNTGNIYVADGAGSNSAAYAIRLINYANSYMVTTLVALYSQNPSLYSLSTGPYLNTGGIALDGNGNLFIADPGHSAIRMIPKRANPLYASILVTGQTPGTSDGFGTFATFTLGGSSPLLNFDQYGNLLVASGNYAVRKMTQVFVNV